MDKDTKNYIFDRISQDPFNKTIYGQALMDIYTREIDLNNDSLKTILISINQIPWDWISAILLEYDLTIDDIYKVNEKIPTEKKAKKETLRKFEVYYKNFVNEVTNRDSFFAKLKKLFQSSSRTSKT